MNRVTRPIRLLVVEDDPAFLYLIRKAFAERDQKFHWEVFSATNGEEAVNLLFAEENAHISLPELILLDWNLPKLSGNEVLHRLKKDAALCRIPVLVFSTSNAAADIAQAYGGHANGFINKPSDYGVLAQIVEAIGHFWVTIAHLPKVVRSPV